jgi:hypothetical protein
LNPLCCNPLKDSSGRLSYVESSTLLSYKAILEGEAAQGELPVNDIASKID